MAPTYITAQHKAALSSLKDQCVVLTFLTQRLIQFCHSKISRYVYMIFDMKKWIHCGSPSELGLDIPTEIILSRILVV